VTIPLTVGMAVYRDFDGVYFTLQSLRMNNPAPALAATEFIVVDNDPDSEHGREIKKLCGKGVARGTAGVRYVPMPEATGTTQPRQRIFDEAKGEAVLVMDSHVLLRHGALARLIEHYSHSKGKNLYSGPMLHDDLFTAPTHFIPRWRGQMWGIWGTAWRHQVDPSMALAYTDEVPEGGEAAFFLQPDLEIDSPRDVSGLSRSAVQNLMGLGYRPTQPGDPPFAIPGMGLGMFTCRRSAWPGFNRHFREFGGEELYIHEKFRQQGGQAICLPWLQWGHRFGRVGGPKYPLSKYAKVRNYVLGFQEIGRNIAEVHHHFVDRNFDSDPIRHLAYEHGEDPRKLAGKTHEQLAAIHARHKLPLSQWEHLMEDPVNHTSPETPIAKVSVPSSLHHGIPPELLERIASTKRDLNEHADALTALASQVDVVWEFTRRVQSTAAFLMSGAKLVSLMEPSEQQRDEWNAITRIGHPGWQHGPAQFAEGRCDLFFCKPLHRHPADKLGEMLNEFAKKTSRWIVVHDTAAERWDDGSPAPIFAVRDFVKSHPDWFVASHDRKQYGLTILSCQEWDRPETPLTPWPSGGPGTHLAGLLHKLGINPHPNCSCRKRMQQMDAWGASECRTNREQIIQWMREGAPNYGWTDKIKAAANAVITGIAFTVNWSDPFPDLIDQAIKLAEKDAAE